MVLGGIGLACHGFGVSIVLHRKPENPKLRAWTLLGALGDSVLYRRLGTNDFHTFTRTEGLIGPGVQLDLILFEFMFLPLGLYLYAQL